MDVYKHCVLYGAFFLKQYGLFFYALGWYLAFVPFTSLGLWAVISRDVGQSKERGRHTIQQALALRGSFALLSACVCGGAGWLIHDDLMTRQLLGVLSVALLGRSMANLAEYIFNAYSASHYVLRLEMTYRPFEVLLGITLLLKGGTLLELAVIHALAWWLQGMHGMYLIRKNFFPVKPEWNMQGISRLLRKGGLLVIHTFLLVWFVQGPVILGRHSDLGLAELGQLALLFQVFNILSQIPRVLVATALPVLSQQSLQEENQDKKLVETGLEVSWLIGSLAALTGWISGSSLVPAIFGDEFREAGAYLGPILYLLIPWSWGNMISLGMFSRGMLRKTTIAVIIGSLVFTLLFRPLTMSWMFHGIMISLAAGLWLWVVLLYIFERMEKKLLIKSFMVNLCALSMLLLISNKVVAFMIAIVLTLIGYWLFLISRSQRRYMLSRIF